MMTRTYIETNLVEQALAQHRTEFAAKVAHYGVWGAGAASAIMALLWLFNPSYPQLPGMAFFLATAAGAMSLCPVLVRQKREALGRYVLLGGLWVMSSAGFLLMPEIVPAATVGYVLLMILGYQLLGVGAMPGVITAGTILLLSNTLLGSLVTPEWAKPLPEPLGIVLNLILTSGAAGAVVFLIAQHARIQERALSEQQSVEQAQLEATVRRYVEYMAHVAQGNLAAQIAVEDQGQRANEPLAILGKGLNTMADSLRMMIVQIKETVNGLSSATTEILAATAQQAAGASEQSAAISETTTTVDELKTIAEQASRRSQEVSSAAQRNVDISQSGQRAVQDTIESMEQIKERVEGIAENILALSEQTQQIGEIIATVNDIASQSNILALNASVEAARAGEHGKGFAVVAVEVRNLAEQSKQATAQVKAILSEIQKATNATVMATEEGTKRVDEGVTLAAQARQSIEQLTGVINESAQAAVQVVAGGRQQVAGIEQIAMAMQNIDQATVQSLVSTRQMERAAQNLNQLAHRLADLVELYELGKKG